MVTHRLAELDMADEILVLQEGCIVERGDAGQPVASKRAILAHVARAAMSCSSIVRR